MVINEIEDVNADRINLSDDVMLVDGHDVCGILIPCLSTFIV